MLFLSLMVLSCNKDDENNELPTYADGEFPEKILIGSMSLKTQTRIEDFGAQNYTVITGTLKIYPGFENSNFPLDLTPLRSLERIERTLIIFENPELTSLEGLHNINWLGELYIGNNSKLENLDGLRGVENIAYENRGQLNGWTRVSQIRITNNNSLENIDGLISVPSAKNINIANNPSLQNLNGLGGIIENSYFRTYLGCGEDANALPYCGNENLGDLCGIQNLFLNGTYDYVYIAGNAFNPSIQDIIDGNCSQ